MNELIAGILHNRGINPDLIIETEYGPRTTFQLVEAAVLGSLDYIEEEIDNKDEE